MPITPEAMLEQLRDIAEKKMANNGGVDYVYARPKHLEYVRNTDCFYVHQNFEGVGATAGCIIGTWAHEALGVELDALASVEGVGAMSALADLRVEGFGGGGTNVVESIATRVQSEQDGGTPWLEAVERVQAQYDGGALDWAKGR